ncbi:spore coat protein [Sporolactobacillus laevolacticus]|jgi:similar to spore coat protein|uniref:spore coat protein n=1 Tax=Sporolactobacillus laevolacticus TaxID=33018 RepID=UPI0025B61EB9|nr:spore coat protein [Sporolactobacillus laevolacticus]MDF2536806.1 yraD [Bacillales bacterium]MDF2911555.1 yraD [Sporolactobacillus laevolacticus]MDN3956733.1 spore coat protein [Sporolactobacillus laevolacticus]
MNQIVQNITGMGSLTEQVVATDFLITAKSGVRNIAYALTETSSPEVRQVLKQYLDDAINTHEQISNFMVSQGYYHPDNLNEQINVDTKAAQTALNIPQP